MREKVIKFVIGLIVYIIVLVIMQFIVKGFGWLDTSILINTIVLTLGWIVSQFVIMFIESRRNKKNQ